MELRHLRYFVVAAEEENFHRAATRLHIAQPALSRRIRDLEYELKVQLFDRNRKRVRLSAVGRSYLADARQMLEEMQLAARRARSIASGEIGMLTLGLRDTLMHNRLVSRVIRELVSKHRDIALKLDPEADADMGSAILEGAVDAAFLYTRPRDNPLIDYVLLANETFAVALPGNHRLARRRELRMIDLQNDRFLWIRRETAPAAYDRVISAFQASGFTPNIVHHGANEMTRLRLVAVGMGITFVHASVDNRIPGVVIRPISDLHLPMHLELAWHKNRRSPALERLIDVVLRLNPKAGRQAARA